MNNLLKDAWTVAIETLSWMEKQRLSERLALVRTTKQLNISSPDSIRYAFGLVVETTRRKNLIDKFVNSVIAPKKIVEFNLGVQSFLRLYVYQTRVEKNWGKINLDEAKSIAGLGRSILGWKTLIEVEPVLGVLLTRQLETILNGVSDEEKVSVQTFHPSWFVSYCFNLFGHDEALAFLKGSVTPPPTYIRLNTLKASEEETLHRLGEEGLQPIKIEPLKYTYSLPNIKHPLNSLHSFKDGLFYVQDKASCFAAEAADPKIGSTVFDVCAAPGAKTTYLAQLMQNNGEIYSVDFSSRRIKVWKQQVELMGVNIAEPLIANACASLPINCEADLVVLDPPCTSTGVFAKQPSAKWRIKPASIQRMAAIQWQMINNCAEKVKLGGALTYSTCSITLEENELIIEKFLNSHPEFALTEIKPQLGSAGMHDLTKCRRLYPHIDQCNGFFIAKLQKISESQL